MSYALDVFIIIILFIIFAAVHTILASLAVKKLLKNKFGSLIALYRLFYNIFALFSFYFFLRIAPHPLQAIYDLPYPFDLIILAPQLTALAGLVWSIKYTGLGEFTGISQLIRWFKGEYSDSLDEKMIFTTEGPYRFVRHPLYLFSIIFLVCRPVMDLFYLTLLVCIAGYFYIGSIYEEKKLSEVFGEDYIKYRERVPRIFPVKIKKYLN
ncbi:MAG TPA: isoprenylcysteine carboxylmethyltransferase family protein [Ignavibacteriaceae bacterium]|nr:isoprenylcysteine carboxylmethyltransferase family protein [Ignavibacteriaceae bacterium]